MIIDTHSHLNFKAFDGDRDEVINKTLESDIWMVNVGTHYETSRKAVEISQKYQKGVYAAVGLHPLYAAAEFVKLKTDPSESELPAEHDFDKKAYEALALGAQGKVVAIGEIGLDYYYRPKTSAKLGQFKEKQKAVFTAQLDLAQEMGLPIILHCRIAHDDAIAILKARGGVRGVVHSFTGTVAQMQAYIAMGFYIGFNGIIFKLDLDSVIRICPLERMLAETDCPYLTPPQEEGKRNEPLFITHTIKKIAGLKGMGVESIYSATTFNAKQLFWEV